MQKDAEPTVVTSSIRPLVSTLCVGVILLWGSLSSAQVFIQSSGDPLSFEAERGLIRGSTTDVRDDRWDVINNGSASGGGAIQASQDAVPGAGDVRSTYFTRFADPGSYFLYARRRAFNNGSNSAFNVDDFNSSTYLTFDNILDTSSTQGDSSTVSGANGSYSVFQWVRQDTPAYVIDNSNIDQTQEFSFSVRENDYIIDRVIFSTNNALSEAQLDAATNSNEGIIAFNNFEEATIGADNFSPTGTQQELGFTTAGTAGEDEDTGVFTSFNNAAPSANNTVGGSQGFVFDEVGGDFDNNIVGETLTFDTVDISGFEDVVVSFDVFVVDDSYETDQDLFNAVLQLEGAADVTMADFGDDQDGATATAPEGFWTTFFALVPDAATSATLQITASGLSAGTDNAEAYAVDNLRFAGVAIQAVPEPASVAIWLLLGMAAGLFAWRRRKA